MLVGCVVMCTLLMVSGSANGQNGEDATLHIQQYCQGINNDPRLKVVTLNNEDFMKMGEVTDGYNQLIGYFRNDSLVKMVEYGGYSNGNCVTEYYLENGGLAYVTDVFKPFVPRETGNAPDFPRTQGTYEARHYLYKGKIIKQSFVGANPFEEEPNPAKALEADARADELLIRRKKK